MNHLDCNLLPTVPFGEQRVTRLIVGGNPFRGNSHLSQALDNEMEAYYTVARIKEVLHRCEALGINAVQARGDALILACLREYRAEGGRMLFIAQTASELRNLEAHVRHLARCGAYGVYVHGSYTDTQYQEGRMDAVHDLLKAIRDAGVRVGLGTHVPEVVDFAEDAGWDLDFYMTALYNLSKTKRNSAIVTNAFAPNERFDHEDRQVMFARIQATRRQCLVFKVFGAGRLCASSEQVAQALKDAYAAVKPQDALVIGMFPKYFDQVRENTALTRQILGH